MLIGHVVCKVIERGHNASRMLPTRASACNLGRVLIAQNPEFGPALRFELTQQLTVNLAYALGLDCLRSINLLDLQACLVVVEVFAHEPAPFVVWPDEGLPAAHMIEPVWVINLVADEPEV